MPEMIFPTSFYRRDTITVARQLLGQRLVHVVNGQRLSGRIVETEAYLGLNDRACHSFGGRRTTRVESMYLEGGHAYVYLIYGMHYCFNVVTRDTSHPEAVLIRALEPDENIEAQRRNRPVRRDVDLSNGPGKLCRALDVDKRLDGSPLHGPDIFVERTARNFLRESEIIASPRIGVDYAGADALRLLRFSIRNNPYVSR